MAALLIVTQAAAAAAGMHDAFARADIGRRHLLVDPPDRPDAVADPIVAALANETLAYGIPQT